MKNIRLLKFLIIATIMVAIIFSGCAGKENSQNGEQINEPALELSGEFYSLSEAYDNGYITREDLQSIAYYYSCGKNYLEEFMDKDYIPIPKNPDALSEETELAIKQSFWKKYCERKNISVDAVWIGEKSYYGTYNNSVAVMVWVETEPYFCAMGYISIGGVNFVYSDNNRILIYAFEKR